MIEKKYIEVVEIDTNKTTHMIDVTDTSPSHIEKIVRGLLRQIDREKYFVKEPSCPTTWT